MSIGVEARLAATAGTAAAAPELLATACAGTAGASKAAACSGTAAGTATAAAFSSTAGAPTAAASKGTAGTASAVASVLKRSWVGASCSTSSFSDLLRFCEGLGTAFGGPV